MKKPVDTEDGSLELEIPKGDAVRTEIVRGESRCLRTGPETDQDTCREKRKAYVRSLGGTLLHYGPDGNR